MDFFFYKEVVIFWIVMINRFILRGKFIVWIVIVIIEEVVMFCFMFNNLFLMIIWIFNINFFYDCLGMMVIWEIVISVEFIKMIKFNDYWIVIYFIVKFSWFIFNLDFFYFFFSFGNFFREWFVKGINDMLLLFFFDFDII